ncbi:phage portal protein, PBSX family [Serratia plymuthica A30]|uniref:phage portal protein n=1 Tax=Serratia plymuthica TaxID=82996 RepID=UPI0002A2DC98|nr:phage portal protein [Serratia plymuthica]EKF65172.1 phage portal protein, PBSX family [Serratia plymuthica A30]
MSKRKGRKALTSPAPTTQGQDFEAFSFGEPSPVLDKREILDYIECTGNGKWYEPPISFDGLARSVRAAVHHSSPMFVKRNILASTFIPHPMLSQQEFSRYALDYLVFGNAFLEVRKNQLGEPLRLQCSPAKYTRRGVEPDTYWFVQDWKEPHQFAPGSVFHLIEPDINQELYGLPEYLSALNSAWLNEAATLFRRKYYQNGAHAGYILYMTDAAQSTSDVDRMRQAMRDTKGLGNFRNLFMYAPNGKPDGIKILPLSEVATKDDFFNIKNATRDDLLSAHRVPPQMMGIIPNNTGGFGDVEKASQVFVRNELIPLQERIKGVNEWIENEVIQFSPYKLTIN